MKKTIPIYTIEQLNSCDKHIYYECGYSTFGNSHEKFDGS